MPDLHIHREHTLGLKQARAVAERWAEEAEQRFDMACTIEEADDHDLVHFKRSGVQGTLKVSAGHFELDARLGLLLGAFARQIESEIRQQLDEMLVAPATANGKTKATAKTASKSAVKATAKAAKAPAKAPSDRKR